MPRPKIGITSWPRDVPYEGFPERCDTYPQSYVRSVVKAGGLPVLIPVLDPPDVEALVELVDAVVLTGGGDVDPGRYGAEAHPRTGNVDVPRDHYDAHLVHHLLDRPLPTLGICRGTQILNVALGGTLDQHRPDHDVAAAKETAHEVTVEAGSLLASIVGAGPLGVNSLHHQALADLGDGVRAVATSADGVVEAVELEDHPHVLAVQWHPEELRHRPEHLALFENLVSRAVSRK
jgi:gamma-glutamyl-gamma-aminobutyrate hydrolase PuuD